TVSTSATRTQSLTENLGITDMTTRTPTKSVKENLGISDTILFKGGLRIETRDISDTLIGGSTYTISPNPYGGLSLIVVDNGANDNDNTTGRISFGSAPFGSYNIAMTTIPSSYNVLGNTTTDEVHPTELNGTSVFRVILQSANLSMMPPTIVTEAPSLNNTTYETWTGSYVATIINETSTHTITKVHELPHIISVGNETSQLNDAILRQTSVRLNLSLSAQTSGQTIMNTLGIQNYSIPKFANIISVLPSFVTTPSGTSQYVVSPPIDTMVSGQKIVIPVESSLLPSYGGLRQLTIESMDGKLPSGSASNDWFVIETASSIPSTIGSSGISESNVNLFVDVKYRYEEDGTGFNWGSSDNLVSNPTLKLSVAKSSSVISDANGCPVLNAYTFNTSLNKWVQTGLTVSSLTSIDANRCELDLSAQHFSRFSLSSTPSSTGSSTSTGSTATGGSGGGGGGGGGGGVGGIGTSSGIGFGGKLGNPVVLYQISYDACDENMVRIIAGMYGTEAAPPNVKIRTPEKEVYSATLADNQPYTEINKALSISRYVYEAPISSNQKYFVVTAEQVSGRIATSTSYLVNVYSCSDTIVVNPMTDLDGAGTFEPTVEVGRPNIFDIKLQVNTNKPIQASTINQFVKGTDQVDITSIIDTTSAPTRAELRVAAAGGNYSNYAAVKMDITQLQNITNTYLASAEVPISFLQAPAIVYWIHVINQENKIQDSEKYYLGVKPTYTIDAKIELDSPPSKSEGSTYRPTAYIYNNGKPLFGSVSLLVDDREVYTSSEYVFNNGQSVIDLEWSIPKLGQDAKYDISARLNLYDNHIDTTKTVLRTFEPTKSIPISESVSATSVVDDAGKTIARVGLMYSSDNNANLHYRVVSPDGTCVIGQSDSCLVKDSTTGNRGNTISVEIGEQIYRIRYSGQDSPLERFSVTSIDPIIGTWHIALESDDGILPEAQAMENVLVKLKYRSMVSDLITVASD
uniref:hypothetical protein n=1 Tax=Candidatus Nitrosotenuis chungbukensis TaxID=1353246 RepID=UPI0005B25866